jgi:hypothetical protein
MKLGLKILVSLEVAVCLSSYPLTALEENGNQQVLPAKRVKRLYQAPRHAGPIPLPENAAPQQPVEQNYIESPFSPRPPSQDDGALPPPQSVQVPRRGIQCAIL